MAKKSKIARQRQRADIVSRHAQTRRELKERVRAGSPEEREEAQRALQRLPRDASPTRLRSRDQVDGRPRGYLRKVGLSRIRLREMAHRGELPGITTSSW
jgi:small subunit ribosomal protein S14